MTGREIRDELARLEVNPSRQLGQNFLIDANVARWIVDRLELRGDETVVEVGPGTGALTEHLFERAKKVILVEFDSRLAAGLKERFADQKNVEIYHADGAEFDVRKIFTERPVKFLGNLPYSSGGAIMKNFLDFPHPFERAVLMLQKEVIERLVALPRTDAYGLLSLRMQSAWDIKKVKDVPPEAFHPRPQIDSSVAVLSPRNDLPYFDRRLFDELIRRGFSQRRKQLKNQLPPHREWASVAAEVEIPLTTRAEELSLQQWITLTKIYDQHPLKDTPQKGDEIFDVVNEVDEVIAQATRREVHAEKKLHRAVHIFVFNKHRELLLQLRSAQKDNHPNVWDSSAAGHLDAGENYADCAVRELEEELGISNTKIIEIGKIAPCENTGWEHVMLYAAMHDGKVHFPAAEIAAAKSFSLDTIEKWLENSPHDFAPGFWECWKLFQKTQNS